MAHPHVGSPRSSGPAQARRLRDYLGVFRFSRRALVLVWTTSRALTIGLALGALLAGLLPGAIAWVGKLLVDAVVAATTHGGSRDDVPGPPSRRLPRRARWMPWRPLRPRSPAHG